MAMLDIVQYPDKRLQRVGLPVAEVDKTIRKIVDDMFDTLYHSENCAALAATQLALDDALRITVIDFSPDKDQPLCLINPEIVESTGETHTPEGCMSVPGGVYEKVTRPEKIHVKALDQNGQVLEFDAEEFMAKCIHHELDHLNGVLFLDRLSALKRQRIDKKLSKLRKA